MNQDCPFCISVRKENRILKEGKHAFVIFSNPRLMPGHLLVIPKRHVEGRVKDLTAPEREEIFGLLSEFQAKILKKISSGCDIRQNYKPYVKNSRTHVNHMHFHLHPREFKDELYRKCQIYETDIFKPLTDSEAQKISSQLKD